MSKTDCDILPIEDEVKNVDLHGLSGVYWGEMSKYADEDFGGVSRPNVPQRLDFVKRLTKYNDNPIGKLVIENNSTVPMTYMIVTVDQGIHTKRITLNPDIGWIAPRSVALLEIRIAKKETKMYEASFGTRFKRRPFALGIIEPGKPYFGFFFIYGAPIFREEYTEQTKLELFWKGYGTDFFPISHAEVHESMVTISPVKLRGDDEYNMHVPDGRWTKNWEHASAEDFNSLWAAGNDSHEHKFCLEFRSNELQHVAKRPDTRLEKYAWLPRKIWLPLFLRLYCTFCAIHHFW